jgi:hypothetical protein
VKISIITTVDHNVGDDFVREGIKYLLRQHFSGQQLEFENIHKHSPITTRHGFEWFRNLRYSRRVDKLIPKKITQDRIFDADLVVQSGAPVYWCHAVDGHCYQNEWYQPLIRERLYQKKNKLFINLAGGTCQTYHSDGSEFCSLCNDYIKEFYDACQVTTVRDTLGSVVLGNIGLKAPVIPCSSIFAINEHNLKSEGEDYVVVNYMKGGSHFVFGQEILADKWQREFKIFYNELKMKERVIFSCHNQKEVDEALDLDPDAEIFFEEHDYLAYMRFYSRAKFGIMNRVHGAFMMASFGKPSIVIGNDSRARMAEEIGLKHYFVNDVDVDLLRNEYGYLLSGANNFLDRFNVIKDKAFSDYMLSLSDL